MSERGILTIVYDGGTDRQLLFDGDVLIRSNAKFSDMQLTLLALGFTVEIYNASSAIKQPWLNNQYFCSLARLKAADKAWIEGERANAMRVYQKELEDASKSTGRDDTTAAM